MYHHRVVQIRSATISEETHHAHVCQTFWAAHQIVDRNAAFTLIVLAISLALLKNVEIHALGPVA